mgnify:CR=1 FL=1
MTRTAPLLALTALTAALSACASGPSTGGGSNRPYISPITGQKGLESVIGATPSQLTRQFGDPRLDVVEPYGRKLQFSGQRCILDAYLYPDKSGDERTTYVDARNSDGVAVDKADCVSALKSEN